MKRILIILFAATLLSGCQKKISAEDLSKINGYWEIEKVIFPDGNHKEYTVNETFDYFNIEHQQGFRKKVTPQLDGTFLVNETSEAIQISKKDSKYFLNYRTPFAKWREELLTLSDSELVTLNASGKEYHYKRAAPINLTGNGKKAQ